MEENKNTVPVFSFEKGIYGFEDINEFKITPASGSKDNPLHIMTSVKVEGIRFILVPPIFADSSYEMEIEDEDIKSLGIEEPEDVMVFSIVSVGKDKKAMTANLKSPIVLSVRTMKGKQIILEKSNYSIKHPLKTKDRG
jgi:flagellar assembly factor FliW